jgi:hypothetical protein
LVRSGAPSGLAAAALIFAIATVVLSYPLAFSPASLSRLDNGDARLNAWAMSWVAHQLVSDPLDLFNANTFYPMPRSLAFSEHLTVQGVLAIPLLALTNDLVLTNNLITLFAMFASALGMYLLVFSLTRSHLAALLGGLFFSFAPFRFNRLPHIQVQLYAFIPLSLAALHRYVDTRRPRWLALGATAFVLQALSGTYLGAIASVALGIALVSLIPFARFSPRELVHVGLSLAAIAVALVPFTLPYLWVHRELGVEWDLGGLGGLSATPQAYLASSSHLYRAVSEALTSETGRTDYLFPGLTLAVLGVAGLVRLLGDPTRRRLGSCYAAILVTGVVLSLGPATPVYPFLYEHVVFFRGLRALTRFGLLPLLSLSVLSSFALAWLFEDSRLQRRKTACALIALFFIVESTSLPYQLETHRDEPPAVYAWLKDQAKPGPFVELPFKVVDTRYMFWARHHGFRPTLNGDSGFIPMSHQWMKVALSRFPSPDSAALLRRLSVRYVILHLGAFRAGALPRLLSGLEDSRAALLPIRDFGNQTVYEVLPGPMQDEGASVAGLTRLSGSSASALAFDGDVQKSWDGPSPVVEIDVELEATSRVEGLRFHYGPVPSTPISNVEVLIAHDDGFRAHTATRADWPAVAELVFGLLETPLDGTQTLRLDPMETGRFRLRLRGLDGRRPDVTEIELFGSPLEPR